MLSQFEFAQPWWLLGLCLVPLSFGYLWYKKRTGNKRTGRFEQFIDPILLPHILLSGSKAANNKLYICSYVLIISSMFIALANPRWDYVEIEAYQPSASMVILLDLSSTMNAQDVQPSRILRARQGLEDLLRLSKGLKIGMIGFAGLPHLVTPITDDLATVRNYLPALDTDLTSVPGADLAASLQMAQQLLMNDHSVRKSILVVSDGDLVSDAYESVLRELRRDEITVNVLAVGTTQGAPYKNQHGVIHKEHGAVVTSKMNKELLQNLAKQGQGLYVEINHHDYGLQQILDRAQFNTGQEFTPGKVRQWQDRYYWFLFPAALLLIVLLQQRGVVCVLLLCGLGGEARAGSISDWFSNPQQLARREFVAGNFDKAAELFTEPYNKGVALYRAGQYAAAEQAFAAVNGQDLRLDGMYNLGNAQMQQQKWGEAIKSYEAVLVVEPDHDDAKHNLEIAKRMLEQQPPEQDKNDCGCKGDGKKQQQNPDEKEQKQDEQKQPSADTADEQQNQNEKEQEQEQSTQDTKLDTQQHNGLQQQEQSAQDAMVEQWFGRIDSDIKNFLKSKFYVEDVLTQK